jgi:hypothetical protein
MIKQRGSIRSGEMGKLAGSTFPVSSGMLGIITPIPVGISACYFAQTHLKSNPEI